MALSTTKPFITACPSPSGHRPAKPPSSSAWQKACWIFDNQIRSRKDSHTGQQAIERPGWQFRFAEAAAEIEAAELVFEGVFRDMTKWRAAGVPVSVEERARVRRNIVFTTKLCVRAVDRLFEGGDASVVYEKSPIQRFYRDIRTVGISISQVWDEPALQFSRVHWGLSQQTMF